MVIPEAATSRKDKLNKEMRHLTSSTHKETEREKAEVRVQRWLNNSQDIYAVKPSSNTLSFFFFFLFQDAQRQSCVSSDVPSSTVLQSS